MPHKPKGGKTHRGKTRRGGSRSPLQDQVSQLKRDKAELLDALERSLKLQSHYALLLNGYDGGERMQFASVDAWLDRLAEVDAKRGVGA